MSLSSKPGYKEFMENKAKILAYQDIDKGSQAAVSKFLK